jgi:nitroimidazol reductase NimA-like FMN-containing flavoprotein (pyridoxamine 5'-phosphate oxidase superfamily)
MPIRREEMTDPPQGLEILTEPECRELLARKSVGRVAITIGALPAILPVNYALLDGDVVFRTAKGSKLNAAMERAVVAFEIDGADEAEHTGWSVLVVGHAEALFKLSEIERAKALNLRAWAPGTRDQFVRVTTRMISGRRVTQD